MNAHRYGPVEIIAAGIDQTRETFADWYVELDRLRRAAQWVWHRAYVDEDVPLLDGAERLADHTPPSDFGGSELATTLQPVVLDRLTDDGLSLFQVGVRMALAERADLEREIANARIELEALRLVPPRAERERRAAAIARARTMQEKRESARQEPEAQPLAAWPDVPVRIPGSSKYVLPGDQGTRSLP